MNYQKALEELEKLVNRNVEMEEESEDNEDGGGSVLLPSTISQTPLLAKARVTEVNGKSLVTFGWIMNAIKMRQTGRVRINVESVQGLVPRDAGTHVYAREESLLVHIGDVVDIFGPIEQPFYVIECAEEDRAKEFIETGRILFVESTGKSLPNLEEMQREAEEHSDTSEDYIVIDDESELAAKHLT